MEVFGDTTSIIPRGFTTEGRMTRQEIDNQIEELLARHSMAMTVDAIEQRCELSAQQIQQSLNRGIYRRRVFCSQGKYGKLWYRLESSYRQRIRNRLIKDFGVHDTVASVLQQSERALTPFEIRLFMDNKPITDIVRQLETLERKGFITVHEDRRPVVYEWRRSA